MDTPNLKSYNVVALIPGMVSYSFRTTMGTYAILFNVDAHTYCILSADMVVVSPERSLPTGTQKRSVMDYSFAQRLLQAHFSN